MTTTHNTANTLEVGTDIYYTGDMANNAGWFTLTKINGGGYELTEKPGGDDRVFAAVFPQAVGTEHHGHCNPRFVTGDARRAWVNECTRMIRAGR